MQTLLHLTILSCLAAVVAGCGSQTYEERLAESQKYFEYRQTVDSILEKQWWQAGEFGLQFRPPKGFVEIPGPMTDEDPDTRQPNFLTRPLPGLIGAWEATVPVDMEGSDIHEQRAWIFICTNHQDILAKYDDPLIEPEKFTERLIENIANLVRDKKVEGITDLRDESDKDGMRIVIELRKGEEPEVILNQLCT